MIPTIGKGVQRQIIAAIVVSFGAFTIGTILGKWWTAGIVIPTLGIDLYADTIIYFNAIFGAIIAGSLTCKLGHRYAIMLGELLVVGGWLLVSLKQSDPSGPVPITTEAGICVQGFGAGAISAAAPSYVGEISLPHIRGSLGVIFYVFLVAGILFAYALKSFVSHVTFSVLCAVCAAAHMVAVFFLSESPYVYLKKGKMEKANTSMTKLRDGDTVAQELSAIQGEIDRMEPLWTAFKKLVNIKTMMIGLCIFIVPSVANIRFIMVDIIYICKHCGDIMSLETFTIIFLIIQLMMAFVTIKTIEKVGRRLLLLISGFWMTFCSIVFIGCYKYFNESNSLSWIFTFLVASYVLAFSLGFGPVPWVIVGEIFPLSIKRFGSSLVTVFYWFIFLIQAIIYSYYEGETEKYEPQFILWCVMWIIGCLFVWFLVPETKNKSLIEIRTMLAGNDDSSSPTVV